MELDNATGLPALLFRTAVDETRMSAAVIARVTYHLGADGQLRRSEEQPWAVSAGPWNGPAGPMPSDDVFYRGGVDLFVFGEAWAPGGRPACTSEVRVDVGGRFQAAVAIFGDRVWDSPAGRGGVLRISPPRSFVSMPLTLSAAYGGRAAWDGLAVTFPGNPGGKGFCLTEDLAPGTPLPNLEDPRRLVQRWNDAPEPVGTAVCPPWFAPRVCAGTTFDQLGRLTALRGRYFNDAFPALVAPAVEPGDVVHVEGVAPEGPLRFVVPAPALTVDLTIGKARITAPLRIDQLGIEPAHRRVFITYRHPFRYSVVARQPRACALRERSSCS